MDFRPDARDVAFRMEVKDFIRAKRAELLPAHDSSGPLMRLYTREELRRWTRALNEKGWAVPHWPLEWGGANWRPTWRHIRDEELIGGSCPGVDAIGADFVGPVIYSFGTPEQKRRYLARIRNADDVWCQGFSEPDAGSDLMRIRTSAVPGGDHFLVNGRKIWTTNAHNANMMFALVRAETPGNRRQQGLSFLLIDMASSGIAVRPIMTLDGRHWINEVVLDGVRVPRENLVGEQGKGWIYARFVLGNERTAIAGLPAARQQLRGLKITLARLQHDGHPAAEDPAYQEKVAQLEIELDALEFLQLRAIETTRETANVSVLASILKLRASELRQRISELAFDVLGESGLEAIAREGTGAPAGDEPFSRQYAREVAAAYLFQRSGTIAGGTSEVQRNVIAAMGLGLGE